MVADGGHGFIGTEEGTHHPVPRLAFYVTTSCSQSLRTSFVYSKLVFKPCISNEGPILMQVEVKIAVSSVV